MSPVDFRPRMLPEPVDTLPILDVNTLLNTRPEAIPVAVPVDRVPTRPVDVDADVDGYRCE